MTKQEIKRREYLLAKIWWDKPTETEIKEFEKLDKKFHEKG